MVRDRRLSWGQVLFDYDSDSDPDLFLNNHYTRPLFYDNQGATMQKRKFPVLVASGHTVYDRHNCMWGEANFDGRPDFYCSSGAQRGRGEGPNQLLLQSSSGFSNATNDYRVADKFGRGRSANWLDFNRDGRLDIYVGNRTRAGAPNVMFRRGRDRFVRADVGLTESFPVVGSYWSDYNLNGYPDLLVLADDKPTVFYRNVGGRFHRTSVPGVTGYPWDSAAWGHYNGDKRSDLALVTQRRLVVMRNKGGSGSPFHEVFRAGLKLGRSVAWFDADNDGDLDLFVVQGRNDGANAAIFSSYEPRTAFGASAGPQPVRLVWATATESRQATSTETGARTSWCQTDSRGVEVARTFYAMLARVVRGSRFV